MRLYRLVPNNVFLMSLRPSSQVPEPQLDSEAFDFALRSVQRVLSETDRFDEVCCLLHTLDWAVHEAPRKNMMASVLKLVNTLLGVCETWVEQGGMKEEYLVVIEKVLLLKWVVIKM